MTRFINRHPIIFAVILIALCVTVVGIVSARTDGFKNLGGLTQRPLNENNLLKTGEKGNYQLTKDTDVADGVIRIAVADNGKLTVFGNAKKLTEDQTVAVAKLTLAKGTYTLSTGSDKTNKSTVWMEAVVGSATYTADFGGTNPGTFELTEETEVTIKLHITAGNDYSDGFVLYPVLVEGKEAGNFYAKAF